jgi:(p)ppGpp synthase/HD superfamily hydrolase
MNVTLAETFAFMRQAHHGQVDKSGKPYWQHPLRVMYRLGAQATEAERHAALLHDVIEDCPVTYDDLRARGYSEEVIEIVRLVSKDPLSGQTFRQWITTLAQSGNVAAMHVKLADLADNLSPARLKTLPPEMHGIDRRFRMAWQIIAERLPAAEVKRIIRSDVPPLVEIEREFALNAANHADKEKRAV